MRRDAYCVMRNPTHASRNTQYAIRVEVILGKPFNYGGQAVLEGVMMRGSKAVAVAVRDPQGKIVIHSEPLNQHVYGGPISRWPFLRGLTMLWDSLVLGMRSLMFSADVATGTPVTQAVAGPIIGAEAAMGSEAGGTPGSSKSSAFEGRRIGAGLAALCCAQDQLL